MKLELPHSKHAGSTATIALVDTNEVIVASAGDSKAVLSTPKKAILLSRDQNPDCDSNFYEDIPLPKFTSSLRSRNGKVWKGKGEIARCGKGLNMSRSLGHGDSHGINPRPEIIACKLPQQRNGKHILILASDGLWDVISPNEASEIVQTSSLSFKEIASFLTRKAYQRGSHDNITVMVVDLTEPLQHFSKG